MKGTTLTLVGVPQKGKNRIREHGNKWLVLLEDESVSCLDDKPGSLDLSLTTQALVGFDSLMIRISRWFDGT